MSSEGMESPPDLSHNFAGAGIARWGWLNVGGVHGNLKEVLELIHRNRLLLLILGETWLRAVDSLKHPAIDRPPSPEGSSDFGTI